MTLIIVPLCAGIVALGISFLIPPTFTATVRLLPPIPQVFRERQRRIEQRGAARAGLGIFRYRVDQRCGNGFDVRRGL